MSFQRWPIGWSISLVLLSGTACGPSPEGRPTERPVTGARPVHVAAVTTRPLERTVQVVGSLLAREEATIAAQVSGQIELARVDLGDRVAAGEELALIDTTSYEALTRQSAAALARANAAAANAAQNLRRIQELHRDHIASISEMDQAVAEADQARAEVKAAEAADAIARLNLERSRVKAPFGGIIAERISSVGDFVAVGTPIFRLVQTDPLRLRLDVPERDAALVRVGQTVRLSLSGQSNVYTGRLTRIAPALRESDRMLAVEADIPSREGLRPGLFVRAEIVVDEGQPGLCIPSRALVIFAGLEKVVLVHDGKALERPVTTGRRGPDWVEVTSGLQVGDSVVLDPAGLRTGQPVVVTTAPSPAAAATDRAPRR